MHFLSEKMKSMLQSKQSDQCNTLRLIHVVVVVSGFRCECFLPNSFFLFPWKAERGWKWREKYRWPAKKAKANVNIDCFSLIKGQWKLFKGQWKVREFLTFWWVATLMKTLIIYNITKPLQQHNRGQEQKYYIAEEGKPLEQWRCWTVFHQRTPPWSTSTKCRRLI